MDAKNEWAGEIYVSRRGKCRSQSGKVRVLAHLSLGRASTVAEVNRAPSMPPYEWPMIPVWGKGAKLMVISGWLRTQTCVWCAVLRSAVPMLPQGGLPPPMPERRGNGHDVAATGELRWKTKPTQVVIRFRSAVPCRNKISG
jgi:hypothetical protein